MNVNCHDIIGDTSQLILPPHLLCKGKRKDTGEWVEGYYVYRPGGQHLITRYRVFGQDVYSQETFEVMPDSIGRCVGIIAKDKRKIFEGDRVNCRTLNDFFKDFAVKYNSVYARFVIAKGEDMYAMSDSFEYEIIGNVSE